MRASDPFPPPRLGAHPDGDGTRFALFSAHATRVELVLCDEAGQETRRLDLPLQEGGIWQVHVPGVQAGQRYGYRVHGPFAPEEGHRFNPSKLLLDPYATEISGELVWDDALGGADGDEADSAPFMPRSVVAPRATVPSTRPCHPWSRTVIQEAHVRGLTLRHPEVPPELRGTFEALACPAILDHLLRMGVTTLQLLPVQGFLHDRHLGEKGLRNYWGYNSLTFFAPHRDYLGPGGWEGMRATVDALHAAGIEVILDVVYNHTAEGGTGGPTLSFRGIDNASYYRLAEDRSQCFDVTGTGNTLNLHHPMVLRLVLDSLRHWACGLGIDGFRFDLAATLARGEAGFDRQGAFLSALAQDPVLSGLKLIAEPWDIGEGGYQLGGFPWPFREWNDKARDDMRGFWRGDGMMARRLSQRLVGSPRQFDHSSRPATSSVNFLTAHDGFTLADLVSYAERHNEANGEDGADGHDNNLSDNMGAEGPTEDAAILAARARRVRAMLATLLLSQGVPMLLAGDELGHSQGGNNNAYAQDNETTWIDWSSAPLVETIASLTRLRAEGLAHPLFATGEAAADRPQVAWLHPEGREMGEEDWEDAELRLFGLLQSLPGGISLLIVFNAGGDARFALPEGSWQRVIDTAADPVAVQAEAGGDLEIPAQSVQVLRRA